MPRMRAAHVRWSEAPAARGSVKVRINGKFIFFFSSIQLLHPITPMGIHLISGQPSDKGSMM